MYLALAKDLLTKNKSQSFCLFLEITNSENPLVILFRDPSSNFDP
jgi:hypothetical protein